MDEKMAEGDSSSLAPRLACFAMQQCDLKVWALDDSPSPPPHICACFGSLPLCHQHFISHMPLN